MLKTDPYRRIRRLNNLRKIGVSASVANTLLSTIEEVCIELIQTHEEKRTTLYEDRYGPPDDEYFDD